MKALLIAIIMLAAAAAHAGSVYKWVDEKGKVHYGDRPAQGSDSLRLEVEAPRSSTSDISAARREKQRRLLEAFELEDAQKKAAQTKQKREKQERKLACARARDNLQRLRDAGYLYRYDKNGKRVIYSNSERKEAVLEAEEAMRRRC
jgi:hypothetical protein